MGRSRDPGAGERLLAAAYELFSTRGVSQVGIDKILARCGCAKASLYQHFESKQNLALAALERREQLWTKRWLESEVRRRAKDPERRLLAIFDVFDGWFRSTDFEGCTFINVLLEAERGSPLRRAAALYLARIRSMVRGFAEEAGLAEPGTFAQAWHVLMKGSIVAAGEGNHNAARQAKRAARLVLAGWERKA